MRPLLLVGAMGAAFVALYSRKSEASNLGAVLQSGTGAVIPAPLETETKEVKMPKNTEALKQNTSIAAVNNNPLNIRASGDVWLGLANPRQLKGFANFISPVYGFRAAARIILVSYKNRGVTKLSDIISTWAPPSDNNPTANYVKFVEKASGISGNSAVNASNIVPVLMAMAQFESPTTWSIADAIEGARLA